MQKCIALIFMCLAFSTINAQNITVKGKIQDAEKKGLVAAMAVLLQPADSLMVGFATSDGNGDFTIEDVKPAEYFLQITYIGYGTIQRKINLTTPEKIFDAGVIVMTEEGKMLETVNISADYVPIKVTKDTVEFNADAFKTQPNAVVEDLLKRLPGVEVDGDGVIKVKGEEVKAVTVDGKEFFGNDPKMATKNLPADAVKKVQVFERKSKTSEFTGINDGNDEMTINLELKADKRNGYFGNVTAGYGTDDRYNGKTMINRFSQKTQVSFLGGLNNLNNSGVNVNDFMSMSGSQGGRNMRNMSSGNSGLPLNFGPNNMGEISSVTAGINLNQDLGKKNKLTFSYYLTQSSTDLRQTSLTNSFLPLGALISNNQYTSDASTFNHFFSTNAEIRIDSTTEMTFRGNLGIKDNTNTINQIDTTSNLQSDILNLNDQFRKNNADGHNYNVTLNVRKKLNKPGRTVTLDGALGANNADDTNRILSEVYGRDLLLNRQTSVFQDQFQFSDNQNYSYGVTYTEPLQKNKLFLIANASRRNNKTDLIKDFLDLDPNDLNALGVLNEELSRTFDNRFVYTTGGLNMRWIRDQYSMSAGLDFQNSELNGLPSIGETVDQSFANFLPKATLELDKYNIRFNYSTSVREPSIDQLQPIVDNTNPLNLYKGNKDLVPEYRHNLRITYNFFDQFNFRGLFASIRAGYTANRITNAIILDPVTFVRTQTPVNTSGETTIGTNVSYNSPLNFMKAKFRAGINSSLVNGINFINSEENEINRWSNGFNVMLENKSKKHWDGSLGGRWSFNNNIYLNNETLNTNFVNQTYEASIAWFAGKNWTIDTKMEYSIYGQGAFDQTTDVKLWQASVSKGFMSNKLTAKLSAFDILNQNLGVLRNASETQVSQSISNTIGRYIMASVTYNLNALAPTASQNPPMHMMMHR
jgi:hypothetical protein